VDIPIIETERLRLCAFAAHHFDEYAAIHGDAAVMRYIGEGRPLSRPEAWRSLATMLGHWDLRGYGMWAVEERGAPGRLLGRVGFLNPEGWPELELGWTLGPWAQGRGYATEAAVAARAHGRAHFGVTRLVSFIRPGNEASVRVAQRVGCRLERRIELSGGPADVWVHPDP
jgi:RimJ/RimL family protein N-acetyltransferase